MRVALVYDRLNKIGGAERVLVAFRQLFPQADWYTSFWDPASTPFTHGWTIHTSPFNRFSWIRRHHEYFPWLMPFIFESFNFSNYDLVISIGSAEAKGIITRPGTLHLHYCLTPTRYLYSHASEYLHNPLYRFIGHYLRCWDQVAATRPDQMIAISTQVKNRIKKYYNRETSIIFPPVDTHKFSTPHRTLSIDHIPSSYFLVDSRLVPYKKIDVIVRAFNRLPEHHLVVIGIGSEMERLKKMAYSNTHFLGSVPDHDLPAIYQHATAYLQVNEEDFGISMVEAQAAGIPVIAYYSGGASDIVLDNVTGLLLTANDVQSVSVAVDKSTRMSFDRVACQQQAKRFDVAVWKRNISTLLHSYE